MTIVDTIADAHYSDKVALFWAWRRRGGSEKGHEISFSPSRNAKTRSVLFTRPEGSRSVAISVSA
jgi:hypothetical protein